MNHRESRAGALAALTGAMLIFGSIGLFRRWIPAPSGLLAFCRALLGATFLLTLLAARLLRGAQRSEALTVRQVGTLMLSGALLGLNWMLLFEAYRHTTVAVATLCYYMQPTMVIFLSPLVFREPLRPKQLACALLSVAGMVLVSGVGALDAPDGTGIALGLAAAALYALIVVLNKRLGPVGPGRAPWCSSPRRRRPCCPMCSSAAALTACGSAAARSRRWWCWGWCTRAWPTPSTSAAWGG